MLNKVQLIGRVGKDPKMSQADNYAIASFSMATSERYKDRQGEQQEKTEWHNVVAFNKLAEIISKYVSKGTLLYVEGKIQTRKYQDKDTGAEKYSTSIVVSEMKMLGGKRDESSESPASSDFDDDIPF
jgi:single-strand DNA-binding protein